MKKALKTLLILTITASLFGQTHDLTQNLIFYLPLDGNELDQSIYSHPMIKHYNPSATTDRNNGIDKALLFDGINASLEFDLSSPNAAVLEFGTSDFTIAFWVKKLSNSNNYDNSSGVSKWNSGAYAGTNEWSLAIGGGSGPNSDQPAFSVAMDGTNTIYTVNAANTDLVVGQWAHVLAMRSGTDIKIYVDGVMKGITSIGSGAIADAVRDLLVARGVSGYYSHAAFDDIVIYDKALSDSEISELMAYGVTTGGQNGGNTQTGLWSSDGQSNIFYEAGKVSIGAQYNNTDYSLAVKGEILTEGVVVSTFANWPDYVFSSDYKVPSLSEVAEFIKTKKHLPGLPSAEQVKTQGFELSNMDAMLLKKIEELMLYTISQDKQIKKQNEQIQYLIKELKKYKQ